MDTFGIITIRKFTKEDTSTLNKPYLNTYSDDSITVILID